MASVTAPSSLLRASLVRNTRPVTQCLASRTVTSRTFTTIPTLRPTLLSPTQVFRARTTTALSANPLQPQTMTATATTSPILDLVPGAAISAHPALAQMQIRCGPRPTLSGATRLIQKRRHGFLSRIRTPKGRKLLARRRAKGRKRLSA